MSSRLIPTRCRECGQASLLLLGVVTLLLGLAVVFFAFGSALGRRGSISVPLISPRYRRGR